MNRFLLVCLLLTLTAIPSAWCQAENSPTCSIPSDITVPSAPLDRVTAALTNKKALDILALGSGSTVGDSGGSGGPDMTFHTPERSFPYRMVDVLRSMKPAIQFNLTVAGGRGMTAESMLAVMRRELATHHYDLVLWQTGTVEAVQGARPDALRTMLQEGADATEGAHANLVLIDPQYSRFLRANVDLGPYETVLAQLTDTSAATLFHRFELTQNWVNTGQVDLERVNRDQRDTTITLLNDCLGQALARYVLAGVGEH